MWCAGSIARKATFTTEFISAGIHEGQIVDLSSL